MYIFTWKKGYKDVDHKDEAEDTLINPENIHHFDCHTRINYLAAFFFLRVPFFSLPLNSEV